MIEVIHVSKAYQENRVLNDVSLEIPDEKITALIGSNGAGKSTLLSIVSRLLNQDSGDIKIDGINMKDMKSLEIAKKMAILKQTNHISMRVTIKELVSFGRFPYTKGRLKKEDEKKIEEAITYMDLKDIENQYIDQLSGGQKQRAYIAMIIAQDTKYILLDEPLNNLDIKYGVEMMQLLQKLVKDLKKTIVVVMHDINFAAAFADHIIAMKHGEIVDQGHIDHMIDKTILDHVFDHDFCIAGFNGKKVCLYYNQMESTYERIITQDTDIK